MNLGGGPTVKVCEELRWPAQYSCGVGRVFVAQVFFTYNDL